MSNFAYKRAKRERAPEPLTFTVDDEEFALAPKLGTKALEGFARASGGDPSGAFDALRALLVGDSYDRFVDLDLDEVELVEVLQEIAKVYDDSGKSSSSPASSNGTGASSTRTSSPTTGSTSAIAGSGRKKAPAASST